MSEELTVVDYAKKAGQLNDGIRITLEGVVKGDIEANEDGKGELDGRDDIIIKTEFDEKADITKTKISIEEPSLKEGIQATEKTGELLWKIKDEIENKLDKTATATSAEKLSKGKNISLEGNVKGTVVFDGSKDVEIQTEIAGGDIKDTVVSFTVSSTKEEIQSGETTSTIVGKIKKWFRDLEEQVNNKLGKNDKAKDSEKLDGKLASEYAPIENPSFDGDINLKGKMITKGLVKEMKTIDLSTLNQDLYYPVITDIPQGKGFFEIIVEVKLNAEITPSWSTHARGFSCYQHMLVMRDGYGEFEPLSICLGRTVRWTKDDSIPVGYSQMTQSSKAVLWLRGGGKYFVWDNNNSDWEIKTTEYISKEQSVKPQSTVVFEFVKSTIHTNIEADNIRSKTQSISDNSTKVATTSFTHSAIASNRAYSTSAPEMNGNAHAGSSNYVSRGNHIHPTDNTRAPVSNPTLTGTVSINNTNTKLNQGNGNSLRITTPSGWTEIASQDSEYSYFKTDRPNFCFDKPITVKGLVKEMKTIDLSTLNQDLYYPVITDIPQGKGFFEIIVEVKLNTEITPSWSTHARGFSCYQHMLVMRDGYGEFEPLSICLGRTVRWTKDDSIPVGYSQMTQSSKAVLWLRGGGKYFVWDNNNSDWEIKTTEYISKEQSVKPQSTVVFEFVKSTIHANIEADNIRSKTQSISDNSTKVATTEFVHNLIKQYLGK